MTEKALTVSEAAELLGISERTLWRRIKDGSAPPYIRIGKLVRFPSQSLKDWLAQSVAA